MAEKKTHLYRVEFDTQKDRRYITCGLFVLSHNQREAKELATEMWHSDNNPHLRTCKRDKYLGLEWTEHPHMFHTEATRVTEEECNKPLREFFVISNKAVTWGYRG